MVVGQETSNNNFNASQQIPLSRGYYSMRGFVIIGILLVLLLGRSSSSCVVEAYASQCSTNNICTRRQRRPFSAIIVFSATPLKNVPPATAWGGMSLPGSDPDRPQKVNQDGYFVVVGESDNNDNQNSWTAIGVMDGHGLKGHEIVRYLHHRLPIRLQQYMKKLEEEEDKDFERLFEQQKRDLLSLANADPTELDWEVGNHDKTLEKALTKAFVAAHLDARMDDSIPSGRSGTTCAMALLVHNNLDTIDDGYVHVYTATVGDSRILVVSHDHENDHPTSSSSSWSVQQWTEATTVNANTAERTRIEASEGRIDGSGNVFYGPVGIAMTRSLGNAVMIRAGVIPIPIVRKFQLPSHATHYICAVTDGICDVLTNEQVMEIIQNSIQDTEVSLDTLSKRICETAEKAWLADLPIDPKVDDRTCVILKCQT